MGVEDEENVGFWEFHLFCITATGHGEFRVYALFDCSGPSMESRSGSNL